MNNQPMLPLDEVYIFDRSHVRQMDGGWMVGIHREKRSNIGLLIAALFVFTLGWSVPTILAEPFTMALLRLNGDEVEAQVTELQSGRSGILQPFTYGRVTYQYQNGETHRRTQPITQETFDQLQVGDAVTIRYASGFARLTGDHADDAMVNNTLVLFWVTVLAFLVIWFAVIRPRLRSRKLERSGQLLKGAMIAYNQIPGAAPKATVQYRFTSPTGKQIVKTEERIPDNVEQNPVKPSSGTPVVVLYVDDRLFHVL